MKRYWVHFKLNKKTACYLAYSYEIVGDKYLFYKTEDKSDSESFAWVKDVAGIDATEDVIPGVVYG